VPVSSAVQLRIDGAQGYGLPLKPESLSGLSEFERGHIFATLGLDNEQREAVEAAVAAVRGGTYPRRAAP
jgi:hypothetical protein